MTVWPSTRCSEPPLHFTITPSPSTLDTYRDPMTAKVQALLAVLLAVRVLKTPCCADFICPAALMALHSKATTCLCMTVMHLARRLEGDCMPGAHMRLRQNLDALPLEELARVVTDCPVVAAQQVVLCVDELNRHIRL